MRTGTISVILTLLSVGCSPADRSGAPSNGSETSGPGDGSGDGDSGRDNGGSVGSDGGDGDSDSGPDSSSDGSDTGDDDSDGDGDGDGDGSDSGDGDIRFDLGSGGGSGGEGGPACDDPNGECGCSAVDILFVIDNSISMKRYQDALAAAFPGFVDAMWDALPTGTDLHVGVTTTSVNKAPPCNSEGTTSCMSSQTDPWIEQNCWITPDVMDTGHNGEQGRLYEYDGRSYYEAVVGVDDPAPLSQWFAAVADRSGEAGSAFEMTSGPAALVTHPANAATNGGFLRNEGAVLVVFVLEDEPDKSPPPGDQYAQTLINAKAACGGPACILASGFVPVQCYDSPNDTTLYEFMNAFGEPPLVEPIADGVGRNATVPDYSALVGDTLAGAIAQTCERIPPVG